MYAEKLNLLFEKSGLSQEEFAKKVGISQSAANNYLNGKREPRISVAKRIADCFGVTIDSMVRDDKENDEKWKENLLNKFNKVV